MVMMMAVMLAGRLMTLVSLSLAREVPEQGLKGVL